MAEWGSLVHYDYGFRIYNPAIAKFLSVDPLTQSYPWYTPYQFAGNDVIRNIDLDGLERGLVINRYSNGQITKTTIQTVSDGNVLVNLNAQGNNIGPLTIQNILEINVGDLPPSGVDPYVVREQFSAEEARILNAGVDDRRTLTSRPSSVVRGGEVQNLSDGLRPIGGFTFPGSFPQEHGDYYSRENIATYDDFPIYEERTVVKDKVVPGSETYMKSGGYFSATSGAGYRYVGDRMEYLEDKHGVEKLSDALYIISGQSELSNKRTRQALIDDYNIESENITTNLTSSGGDSLEVKIPASRRKDKIVKVRTKQRVQVGTERKISEY